jgi:TolB-like protein
MGSGHRWLLPATVVAVVALVAASILRVPPEAALYERVVVAVFPFEQSGQGSDQLPTDVSMSIAAKLRGAPGIVIVSGDRGDLVSASGWLEVASSLEAEFALLGTIQPDSAVDGATRWLVIPHLIRVADAGRQWSGRYSVGVDSMALALVQARMATDVANAIRSASQGG